MMPLARFGLSHEQFEIDRQNDGRRSLMLNDPIRSTEIEAFAVPEIRAESWFGIHAFDDREPVVADVGQNTDWTQQSRCVVDQIEERAEGKDAEQDRYQHDQLVGFPVHPVLRAERKHQRKYEDADGVFDDVVAQQRCCDDPRRHLRTSDLDCDQQGTESEDHEGERRRDERLE